MKVYAILSSIIVLMITVLFTACSEQIKQPDMNTTQTCDSIMNVSEKNDCYKSNAISSLNATLCDSIEDIVPIYPIRMTCYNEIAILTKNASLCTVYTRYNSASICIKIVAVALKDSSVCVMDDLERDLCYYRIATLNSDATECSSITDKNYQDNCLNDVLHGGTYYCTSYGGC